MKKIRTRKGFERLSASDVGKTMGKTAEGFTGNPDLPTPPVLPTDLFAKKDALDEAVIKADNSGVLATARKDALLGDGILTLNRNASYVDMECKNDLTILLSSGYEAVSTNRAQAVLNAPQILGVGNGQSGELKPRIKADKNTRSFVGRIKPIDGEYGATISFASSRKILFEGLTAGMKYVFQLMAIGGSTGQSDWSDPGSGMAQ
jgi:hypothetical protein